MSDSIRLGLFRAVHDLDVRGLHLSSKWASELLLTYLPENEHEDEMHHPYSEEKISSSEYGLILFTRSLVREHEYQRAAHLLRKSFIYKSGLPASFVGKFLYFYSLYMAGEKSRDLEKSGNLAPENSKLGNPYIREIVEGMYPLYINVSEK